MREAVTRCGASAIGWGMSQALRIPSHETNALFDPDAVIAEFQELATSGERENRTAVAQRLKAVLAEGLAKAEGLLLRERQGGRCAARLTRMRATGAESEGLSGGPWLG